MNKAVLSALGFLPVGALVMAAAIAFGGPAPAPEMASINNPFKSVDESGMPALSRYGARDGAALAYRHYAPSGAQTRGSVVLVHGSSASSRSMHTLARAFAEGGFESYVLDIRGHGESGQRGTIGYIGQLEDDLEDFSKAVTLRRPSTLAGFSAGGGFALRFAASSRQEIFDNYLFLSPFLSQDARNFRAHAGGWVQVGIPRIVGLTILNALQVSALNQLPVTNFALNEQAKSFLTPSYSFALATNFRPNADYQADLRNVRRPTVVLAGADDEVFRTDQLEPELRAVGVQWPVTLVPGVGHVPLTLEPRAVEAAVQAVRTMDE